MGIGILRSFVGVLLSKMLGFFSEVGAEVKALDDHAENVFERQVRLLNIHRHVRWYDHVDVRERGHVAALAAGVGDGVQTHLLRQLQRLDAVLRVAAGRNREEHIALDAERFNLPLEDIVVAVIVADGGENAGVGGKRDGAQGRPGNSQPRDELGNQVLRIGSRSAVAAYQQLAAGLHGRGGKLAGLDDRVVNGLVRKYSRHGGDGLSKLAADAADDLL